MRGFYLHRIWVLDVVFINSIWICAFMFICYNICCLLSNVNFVKHTFHLSEDNITLIYFYYFPSLKAQRRPVIKLMRHLYKDGFWHLSILLMLCCRWESSFLKCLDRYPCALPSQNRFLRSNKTHSNCIVYLHLWSCLTDHQTDNVEACS